MRNQSFLLSLLTVLFLFVAVSAPVLAYDGSDQGAAGLVVASSDHDHDYDKDDHDDDKGDHDDDKDDDDDHDHDKGDD